ncbi:hypothetical protein G6R29_05280 [Fructobacillus sp. M2-14]|uniref:LcnD-like C-terminal domain-containing protein n=1 Tax=Fructobacillus broussonetiae TaxID=2713173 RepID=A0ABS5R1X6_9LACO|nr:hypothetical protein [Fructobacillus broussonetiae]MBS9339032.1 hypothetical protein [Fructobacillus broussonetiae]
MTEKKKDVLVEKRMSSVASNDTTLFYEKRYQNFWTRIIWPVLFLLIGVMLLILLPEKSELIEARGFLNGDDIIAEIPANRVQQVAMGQATRFYPEERFLPMKSDEGTATGVIEGEVATLPRYPIQGEKGMLYQVQVKLKRRPNLLQGTEGKVTIITGRKSGVKHYKEKFFHN